MRALSVVCTDSPCGAELRLLVRVCDAMVMVVLRGSIDASALTDDAATASSCEGNINTKYLTIKKDEWHGGHTC
jgi:hypothetical protein